MECEALSKSFRWWNRIQGRISISHPGDKLDLDNILDAPLISSLICDLRVTVVSDEVPENAEYKVCLPFHRVINGETYSSDGKPTVYLPKAVAVELMARGLVRPVDEKAWYPGKPLQAADLVTSNIKRMYDTVERSREDSWVMRYKKQ